MPLFATRSSRLLPLIVVSALPMLAQGVSTQLNGRVTTATGAGVGSATVVVRNLETGFVRSVQTDANGRYTAPLLPVGPYSVTVTKPGFRAASNLKITLNLGDAAPLNVKLAEEASATVEVSATVAQIDSERTTSVTNVSPDALAVLPVKGRAFTDFALLTPQVTVADRGNLAIGGQRGVNTSINIDGGDYNESFFGGVTGAAEGKTPFTVSIEAIREFQVITDGASAEFGRMGGGYLNAITKSGSNTLTGSLFFYTRPQSLVAKDHLTGNEADDFKTQQFGFSLGGPIIPDKLFYFVAYDGQREERPTNFRLFGNNSATALDPVANPNDAVLLARSATYSTKSDSDVAFFRLDWNLNADHNLQFRVNRSQFKGDVNTAYLASNFLNTYDNTSSDEVKTTSLVAQWNWIINNNWFSEARFNFVRDDLPRDPRSTAPQVGITNVATYGGYTFSREFTTKRLQFSEAVSYVTPTLQVKSGIDINKTEVAEVFASTANGSYSFSNLANFRAGNWTTYQQRFGLNGLSARESGTLDTSEIEYAAFVQADWRMNNSMKLGLGLRWDRQEHPDFAIANFSDLTPTSVPSGFSAGLTSKIPNSSDISPRLSFTWTPEFDNGKTVMRANIGRYISRTPSVFLYQVYTVNGVRAAQVSFSAAQAATYGIPRGATFNAANPFVFTAFPTGATAPASDIFTFDPDFRNPRTDRFNLSVERAFGAWVVGITGVYAKGEYLERLTDINLPAPTLSAQGREIFSSTRPNVNYRQMMSYVSDVESKYRAATISLKHQKEGSPLQMGLFYTWSKDEDSDSNERNFSSYSIQNTQRLADEWGPSNNDRRHVVTGYVSYHERKWSGLQAGFNVRYLTGTPYSLTNSNDLNNDGVRGNDRLVGTTRNEFWNGIRTVVDLKLSREWRFAQRYSVTASAEIFNLFNHVQRYDRRRFSGTDAAPVVVNAASVASSGREVQLGARFAF